MTSIKQFINRLIAKCLLVLIKGYRLLISPLIPPRCRFYPTCSSYAIEALRLHGGIHGGWLAVKRVCRCHPWGGSGIDFVPLPLYRLKYHYITPSKVGLGVWYWGLRY